MIETLTFDDITLLIVRIDADGSETRREAERKAVGLLLDHAFGPGCMIDHNEAGAPLLKHRPDISLSISHSRHYAAIAYSKIRQIGVDIEEQRCQLKRVAARVMSENELAAYTSDALLLRAWTMKEALYKAALTPGLDFRRDITLPIPPDSEKATAGGRLFSIVATIVRHDFTLTAVAALQ